MRKPASVIRALCAAGALLALPAGCHSPWIQCTIVNDQTTPVSLVQVSYPGGTFGVQTIAAGGNFHYRFRDLGDDQASIEFTDAAHKDHTVKGPQLRKGQQGTLRITIEPDNQVRWEPGVQATGNR